MPPIQKGMQIECFFTIIYRYSTMKSLLTFVILLNCILVKAQSYVLAVTGESSIVTFDKLSKKEPLNIKSGDTVVLYKFNVSSKSWTIKYKGSPAFIKDTVLEQTYKLVRFKNTFLDKEYKKAMIKKYGPVYGPYVFSATPTVGMTKAMFNEFMNKPDEVNRTVGTWGVHEQWVYSDRPNGKTEYYYFENGKLTSWQD
jgi:hypothetical protein